MNHTLRLFPLVFALIATMACDRQAKPSSHDEAAHKGESGHAEQEAHLPLAGIRGLSFLVVPEPRSETAWFPAEAIGDESAQALLSSPVKGIVSAIHVPPGQQVGAGVRLITLQSPELARLKADWLSSKARRERTEAELVRELRLFEAQAGSRRELEAARSDAAAARADEEAARLGLEARGQSPEAAGATLIVKVPKGGSVTSYKVQLGQGVEAGQELGCFQSASAAIARLELPSPAPEDWHPGAVTEVRRGDGQLWRAHLEGTPNVLTTDTRRHSYRLRLRGALLPLPGSSLEVKVPLGKAIHLPQAALQQVEGRWGVYVVNQGEALFRPIKRGLDMKDEVLVVDGVKPGETIVGEGAYLLKAYQQKRTQPEAGGGHGH